MRVYMHTYAAASAFIQKRCPDMKISTRNCFIEKIDEENSPHFEEGFYEQFDLVICGLDNLEARQWMSDRLIKQVKPKLTEDGRGIMLDSKTVIPMIDGGTEGMFVHYRLYSHAALAHPI